MKKVILGVLAVAFISAPALADLSGPRDRSNTPVLTPTAYPLDSGDLRAGTVVYDSLRTVGTAGYWAAAAAPGVLGYDDYDTISGVNLTGFYFVGGLTATASAGGKTGVMWVEFYDPTTGGFLTSFGMAFPAAGNFIWGLGFASPFTVPHSAIIQLVANTTFTGVATTIAGQWFQVETSSLAVGSNNPLIGGGTTGTTTAPGAPLFQAFKMTTPEPTTLGLLGAGMLLIIRRRR